MPLAEDKSEAGDSPDGLSFPAHHQSLLFLRAFHEGLDSARRKLNNLDCRREAAGHLDDSFKIGFEFLGHAITVLAI